MAVFWIIQLQRVRSSENHHLKMIMSQRADILDVSSLAHDHFQNKVKGKLISIYIFRHIKHPMKNMPAHVLTLLSVDPLYIYIYIWALNITSPADVLASDGARPSTAGIILSMGTANKIQFYNVTWQCYKATLSFIGWAYPEWTLSRHTRNTTSTNLDKILIFFYVP